MYSPTKTRATKNSEPAAVAEQASSAQQPATQVIYPFEVSHELRTATDYRALSSDKKFIRKLIGEVSALIARNNIEVFSFDVFDTALMRNKHSEARRFYTVSENFARKNEGKFSVEDALVARALAARAAYTFATPAPDGTCEGSLALISSLTCSQLGVPAMSGDYVKTEFAFEKEHLTVNPMIVEIIRAFPSVKCIFLSDMYLESPLIKRLLQNGYGKSISVLSSADGRGSKRCGGLYGIAADQLGLPGERILHFGDSLESDYRQAKRNGWNAFYLPISDTERAERLKCHESLTTSLTYDGVALSGLLRFNC
ncbi:hypothetical protein ACFSQU_17250 [Massilia sp. GCM10020059]|uniref:HAD family hydrolase n=1 Tax=Massilia agrisoli TaxID=2892444 RepID=A0ABS8IRM8_9BURK|nr:hypothetical protein [Massilia agrisoli]MCC6071285.1 hypothetical protein [Massilia agrisoli]